MTLVELRLVSDFVEGIEFASEILVLHLETHISFMHTDRDSLRYLVLIEATITKGYQNTLILGLHKVPDKRQ